MVAVDFCCFGSCLLVNFFGTKPGHHAVTSITKPGPAILTWPISFAPCLLISIENHPHHCYYCKTTFVLFEEVIKHSTENHGSLMLKVKYLELNPSSGHYGVEILYHSINNGGCGFLLLRFLFVRKFFWNKTQDIILTWPISFAPCLLISIIKSTKWRFLSWWK
jgi:hypothetical protein